MISVISRFMVIGCWFSVDNAIKCSFRVYLHKKMKDHPEVIFLYFNVLLMLEGYSGFKLFIASSASPKASSEFTLPEAPTR